MKKILMLIGFMLPIQVFAQVWVARYDGTTSGDGAYAIAVDDSGYIYVTGSSIDTTNFWNDYATIKYNTLGDTVWVRRYDGPSRKGDGAYGIAIDEDGNVYVTGGSYDTITGTDYATVKYNSSGDIEWVQRYNGNANDQDIAYAIALDNTGYVYVTGLSISLLTGYDYATIKYSTVGVEENNDKENAECLMLNAYPNPFTRTTIIKFKDSKIEKLEDYKIQIYDITGRLIEETNNTIIGKDLQSGISLLNVGNLTR